MLSGHGWLADLVYCFREITDPWMATVWGTFCGCSVEQGQLCGGFVGGGREGEGDEGRNGVRRERGRLGGNKEERGEDG